MAWEEGNVEALDSHLVVVNRNTIDHLGELRHGSLCDREWIGEQVRVVRAASSSSLSLPLWTTRNMGAIENWAHSREHVVQTFIAEVVRYLASGAGQAVQQAPTLKSLTLNDYRQSERHKHAVVMHGGCAALVLCQRSMERKNKVWITSKGLMRESMSR